MNSTRIILLFCCLIGTIVLKASEPAQFITATKQCMVEQFHQSPQHGMLQGHALCPDILGAEFPDQAARRIRTRFRAVSSYYFAAAHKTSDPTTLAATIDYTSIPTGNQTLHPPFYYIFLFRLKPF